VTISGQSPVNGNDQCLFWAEEVECDSLALSSTILANMEVCYWMTETQDGNSLENRGFMIMEDSRASYPILHEYEISFCCVKPLRSGGVLIWPFFFFFFLRWSLAMLPGLASNLWSSCIRFTSAGLACVQDLIYIAM
jgi:hypothetical protein